MMMMMIIYSFTHVYFWLNKPRKGNADVLRVGLIPLKIFEMDQRLISISLSHWDLCIPKDKCV